MLYILKTYYNSSGLYKGWKCLTELWKGDRGGQIYSLEKYFYDILAKMTAYQIINIDRLPFFCQVDVLFCKL